MGHPYLHLCNEVAPGLWMGGCPSFVGEAPAMFNTIVRLYDEKAYAIHAHQVVIAALIFDTAVDPKNPFPDPTMLKNLSSLVAMAVRKTGPVLVHCQQGFNRSGLIVALALVKMGSAPKKAIEQVRARREGALFNQQFVDWILEHSHDR